MNAYLHLYSVRKPLQASIGLQTTHASCCSLGGLQTAYRTRLRVWASVVKVTVRKLSVCTGKIDVGGLYHFILLLSFFTEMSAVLK